MSAASALPFTLRLGADPEQVREILIAAAKDHDHVLSIPSPQVLFAAVGEANMQLELLCFIEDVEMSQRDVRATCCSPSSRGCATSASVRPPRRPTVTSPALDKLDAWLSGKMAETPVPLKAARTG